MTMDAAVAWHITLSLIIVAVLAATPALTQRSSEPRFCNSITITQLNYPKHLNVTRLRQDLQARVDGCQYVHGNLIINNLGVNEHDETPLGGGIDSMDTDFLDSIEEISGSLEVYSVNLRVLTLRNLRAIRGYSQEYVPKNYSMRLIQSPYPMKLQLPKLTVILEGSVQIIGSIHVSLYCPLTTHVPWYELFNSPSQKFVNNVNDVVLSTGVRVNASTACTLESVNCSGNCRDNCWSSGSGGCIGLHRCSLVSCPDSNCYKNEATGHEQCCSPKCIGGCTSPDSVQNCNACKEVSLDGKCVEDCHVAYHINSMGMKPTGKPVQVGNICASSCPRPFLTSASSAHSPRLFCLVKCPEGQVPSNGVCRPCTAAENCRECRLNTSKLTQDLLRILGSNGCSIWTAEPKEQLLTIDEHNLNNSLAIISQLRYFYGKLIIKKIYTDGGIDFLANLRFVSNGLYLLQSKVRYLGLASLESTLFKVLKLHNLSGLCPAWFPTALRANLSLGGVVFENSSSPACASARCHPQCQHGGGCWGPGPALCVACRAFRVAGRCVADCREAGRYGLNSTECGECHPECHSTANGGGCTGPSAADCVACRRFREAGDCVAACSRGLQPDSSGRCYSRSWLVGVCVAVLALLALVVALPLAVMYYRGRKLKWFDLDEHLPKPSHPNDMAKLLIVNDDDIVKQKKIGKGAFGTVYKGILRVATDRGIRELPVAIKVLHGQSPKLGQELLNEASVLARVRHQSCIRLVAICLTQAPQLITALMPRGCLLEFVRERKHRISSERMLRWFLQVAEGMAYLQSKGILHRDLAARNVLLQTPDQVCITDFGLARLLNVSERELASTEGILPYKWLSLESLESLVFSHQSDVWSFGVLLWEVCTFGEDPYRQQGIRSIDGMLTLLRKGNRLCQPDICSVDFYYLLLSCWLPLPSSRPTFTDLVASINEYLKSPAKYIAAGAVGVGGVGGGVRGTSSEDLMMKATDYAVVGASAMGATGADTATSCVGRKDPGSGTNTYILDPTSGMAPSEAARRHRQVGASVDTEELEEAEEVEAAESDTLLSLTSPERPLVDRLSHSHQCDSNGYLLPRMK